MKQNVKRYLTDFPEAEVSAFKEKLKSEHPLTHMLTSSNEACFEALKAQAELIGFKALVGRFNFDITRHYFDVKFRSKSIDLKTLSDSMIEHINDDLYHLMIASADYLLETDCIMERKRRHKYLSEATQDFNRVYPTVHKGVIIAQNRHVFMYVATRMTYKGIRTLGFQKKNPNKKK